MEALGGISRAWPEMVTTSTRSSTCYCICSSTRYQSDVSQLFPTWWPACKDHNVNISTKLPSLETIHWTPRTLAKYPSELMEALRTNMDDVHYGYERLKTGWIWIATWPHTAWFWTSIAEENQNEVPFFDPPSHLLLSADVACGLSKHGIISSLRWVFFRKCECHASSR